MVWARIISTANAQELQKNSSGCLLICEAAHNECMEFRFTSGELCSAGQPLRLRSGQALGRLSPRDFAWGWVLDPAPRGWSDSLIVSLVLVRDGSGMFSSAG